MKIIKHVHGMYDVFFGDGWENWTRIQVKKDKHFGRIYINYVAGIPLTKESIFAMKKEF